MGTIRIKKSFFFLMYQFFIYKPSVVIDGGEPQAAKWDTSDYQVPAGSHTVTIYVKQLFIKVAKAEMTVDVPDGGVVELAYKPTFFMFWKGKLAPAAAAA